MHIADTTTGNLGANAIVGAGIPIAVGAALASSVKKAGWVAVSFFGEGAVGEGVLHESLNLAALWRLPMIFVCENNHYAELSAEADVLAVADIAGLAQAFDIPGNRVDGNDVDVVATAARDAIERGRAGGGPTLLELDTYRQAGHFEGDQMLYRSREEAADWALKDPLRVAEERLGGIVESATALAEIRNDAAREMDAAIAWAEEQPHVDADSLLDDVYEQDFAHRHPWLGVEGVAR